MYGDFERSARAPDSNWPAFYAAHSSNALRRWPPLRRKNSFCTTSTAVLFFTLALAVIDRLGVAVELRDIFADLQYQDEPVAARGRTTVPVLRITSPGGEQRWLPESSDIAHYLEATYG